MSGLDCDQCDGAACIPEDEVRLQLHQLDELMVNAPEHEWSEIGREQIDSFAACPVSAGYAMFYLSVEWRRCRARSWIPVPLTVVLERHGWSRTGPPATKP